MPDFCAAYGCSNERTEQSKEKGITFHRFPKEGARRQSWVLALKRAAFVPKTRTLICSCHFLPEHFDRTGQTVRLREGAIPSIFNFPKHLSKRSHSRSSRSSKKAAEPYPTQSAPAPSREPKVSITDHQYCLDPVTTKQKLTEYEDQIEKLRRELRNAKDRERRQRKSVRCLLEELKEKNMLTEELHQKLDSYSDLSVELFKQDHAFTPKQKEFALTLHLHGPKAYSYLRDIVKIPLPHPRTLRKWLQTVYASPGLNICLLDMLQKGFYGQV